MGIDINKCKKCGRVVDYFFRYCPSCGERIYISLEALNAKPELFIDLLNSLYNLIADKNNDRRTEYFPVLSESIIIRRCKIEYDDQVKSILLDSILKGGLPDALRDLYHLSLTNTLSGYTYRSIEEFIVNIKSEKLSESEKNSLISSLFKEAGEALRNDCYKVLNPDNIVDNRVLFCLSLRWDNRHMKYLLADEKHQSEWYSNILSQNTANSMKYHEKIYKILRLDADVKSIIARKQNAIQENVEQDIIFGYIVKLCESLNPY